MGKSSSTPSRGPSGLIPGATIFFASGCIVTFELAAARLVARSLGSSLYTWTFVPAVVLAGVALGSLAGGRLADRFHTRRTLSVLFALTSAACVALVIVDNVVREWIWLWRLNWPAHVLVHVCLVFLAPSALLGAVGPVVVKMALERGEAPGRTAGALLAWAAAGCIAGTLLTGFVLIASFGTTAIVWALGAALLTVAVLYWVSCWVLYLWAMIFAALAAMGMAPAAWAREGGVAAGLRERNDPGVVYRDETSYQHVWVDSLTEQPARRVLWLDQRRQGEVVMGDATNLRSFHAAVWAGLLRDLGRDEGPLSVRVIGAAGYVLAQYVKAVRPDSEVEVVQIDPGVAAAATEALGLDPQVTIRTVNEDPRCYLNELLRRPQERCDLIVHAGAVNDYAVPFQSLTVEFTEKIAAALAADGLYLVSLNDVPENGRFLAAVVNTLERTFARVWVIAGVGAPGLPQSYVVVAAQREFDPKRALSEHDAHLAWSVLDDAAMARLRNGCGVVMTDDYAPVQNLLASAARRAAGPQWARRCFRQAGELRSERRYEQSIALYRQAAAQDPALAMTAYHAVGLVRLEQGDAAGAAESFRGAVDSHIETGLHHTEVASIHLSLGGLLRQMGKPAEAQSHLAAAARHFRLELERHPRSVHVWESLGDALVHAGRFEQAAEAFAEAVALDPENLACYHKLSTVLETQQRYDEAISVARRQLDLLRQQGRRDAARETSQYIDFLEYQKTKN